MRLTPEMCQDAQAAAVAEPDRDGLVTVTLLFPGDVPVQYLVRGPVVIESDTEKVEIHCDRYTGGLSLLREVEP